MNRRILALHLFALTLVLGLSENQPVVGQVPKPRLTLEEHKSHVRCIAFSPDGKALASGGLDIRLWDLATGKNTATFKTHKGITSVAFSPDSKTLASGGQGDSSKLDQFEQLMLWDVASGKKKATLEGHKETILSAAFSPDGKFLASCAMSGSIKLWEVASGKNIDTMEQSAACVAFSPDGKSLASGGSTTYDGGVRLWNMASKAESGGWSPPTSGNPGNPDNFFGIALTTFSPNGKFLAVVYRQEGTGRFRLLDLAPSEKGGTLQFIEGPSSLLSKKGDPFRFTKRVSSLSFSSDSRFLAAGAEDGFIEFLDLKTNKTTAFEGHGKGKVTMAFSPDGKTLATAGADKTIKLWNVDQGNLINK